MNIAPAVLALAAGCAFTGQEHAPSAGRQPVSYEDALRRSPDILSGGQISFAFGDAHLVEEEIALLDRAAGLMKRHPDTVMISRTRLYLGGATEDSAGEIAARFSAIRNHMIGAGITAERLVYDPGDTVTERLAAGTHRRAYSAIDFVILRNRMDVL